MAGENPPHISAVKQFLLGLNEIDPWSLGVEREIGVMLATQAREATLACISDQDSILPEEGRRLNAVLAEARRELKRLEKLKLTNAQELFTLE